MVALTGIERACRQCWQGPVELSRVVSVLAVTRDGRERRYGFATWSPGGHPLSANSLCPQARALAVGARVRYGDLAAGNGTRCWTSQSFVHPPNATSMILQFGTLEDYATFRRGKRFRPLPCP